MDDVAGFDRGIGTETTTPVEVGDRRCRTHRPLRHELLLVDEAHRAHVLARQPRGAFRAVGECGRDQRPEVDQPGVRARLVDRAQQRGDALRHRRRHAQAGRLAIAQERGSRRRIEALDEVWR